MKENLSTEEFQEWYADHKENCECNYKGSFNGMEVERGEASLVAL